MIRQVKHVRIGFSVYGLFIVALQLLPNIVWALWPPSPNALENNVSSVLFIEYGEHILGVAVVVLLLFLVNKTQASGIPHGSWTTASFAAIALYWVCWVLYFAGIQPVPVIYAMVILPPVAFFSAGAAERIWPISATSVVFLVFHLLVALENFPLGL
jgi:hypothetical protein